MPNITAENLNKLAPLYMATHSFEVADEDGNIVVIENYDIIILVQLKVYTNTVKYYMCTVKESTSTSLILRSGDVALNHLIGIKFVESDLL